MMSQALNELGGSPAKVSVNSEFARDIIVRYVSKAPMKTSNIQLTRGIATIPLNGIDVPFHSTYLRHGIDAYRTFLASKLLKGNVDPERLEGKFIPNVIGKPFSVSKQFVEEVSLVTGSEAIRRLLSEMT